MSALRSTSRRNSSRLLALATVAVALAAAPKASAQSYFWRGGDHDLFTDENWDGGIDGGYLNNRFWSLDFYFGYRGYADTNGIVNMNAGTQYLSSLNFGSQSWTFTGGLLDVRSSAFRVAANSPTVEIKNDIRMSRTLSGGELTLDVAGSSVLTLSGSMYGEGWLTKFGTGTAILTNGLTYTGGTTVNGGRLIIKYPTGNFNTNGDIEFNTDLDQTLGGTIFGAGRIIKSGARTLTLNGDVSWTGKTTVNGGRLIMTTPGSSSSFEIADKASLEFQTTGTRTYANPIQGAGSFTKSGTGTLTLSGVNTYTGGTTVNAGRLIDLNPHGNYATKAALEFEMKKSLIFSNVISGPGSFTKSGRETLYLFGLNTYTGGTVVNQGTVIDFHPHGDYNIANGRVEFRPDGDLTYSGLLSGAGEFNMSGDGVLTLTRSHSYTGGTNIQSGRLIDLNPSGNYYSSYPAANLEFRTTGVLDFNNTIAGFGSFTKSGSGTLTLMRYGYSSGDTTVNEGTLATGIDDALWSTTALTVSAKGTFAVGAGRLQPVGSLAGEGKVAMGAGSVFTVGGTTDTTFSGVLSGAGRFVKSGAGTLTFAGVNTYTSDTAVEGGRLADQNPHGNYAVSAGASLELQTSGVKSFSGSVSGVGGLVKGGWGTLTLSGVNTYTGGTVVDLGRLIDLNPRGSYVTNADLEFAKAGDYAYDTVIKGSGNFIKGGAGVLTLGAVNTYTGTTTVSGGTLKLGAGGSLAAASSLAVDLGATFDLNGHAQTFAWLQGAGAVKLGDGVLTVRGGSFSGVVSGTGSLTKRGTDTLTLSGVNAYTGGTNVNGGRLIDLNPHGAYALSGGAELDFRTAANTTASLSGAVTGTGSLVKSGAGTLTLAKAPTNSGGVLVSQGTLSVDGAGAFGGGLTVDAGATFRNDSNGTLTVGGQSLNAGSIETSGGSTTALSGPVSGAGNFVGRGTVRFEGGYSPGNSPASVEFDGNMVLGSTNVLTMELGGTMLGTGYDHLTVDGLATLGGALNVSYTNGFSASWGQSFDLFDFMSSNGAFASVNLPSLSNGLVWNTSALYTTGTVQAVPEPASLAVLGLGGLGLLRRRRSARKGCAKGANGVCAEEPRPPLRSVEGANGRNCGPGRNIRRPRLRSAYKVAACPRDEDTRRVASPFRAQRSPSGLVALAAVVAALTAAPKAQAADYFWLGGNADNWSNGFNTYPIGPSNKGAADAQLYFGLFGSDANNTANNDLSDNFYLNSLFLLNQSWRLQGGSLLFSDNGSIVVDAPNSNSVVINDIKLQGSLSVSVDATSKLELYSNISGAGSLVKYGAGSLRLTGPNPYTGGTTVSGGRLTVTTPSGNYVTNAALEFATFSDTFYSGAISGTGSFTLASPTTVTLNGTNTYTGGTTVSQGRLVDLHPHGDYLNNAVLEMTAGTLSGGISGTGAFEKIGTGILFLGGHSTYAGATTVSGGTLVNYKTDVLPTSTALTVAAGASYFLSGDTGQSSQTVGSIAGAGSVNLGGGKLTVGGARATTFSGALSGFGGSLALTGTGTLTLTGAQTYTGGTTVNGGRLIVAAPNGSYVTNTNLEFAPAVNTTYTLPITGTGSFTKSGAGTLTLMAFSAYQEATTVTAGTLTNGVDGVLPASTALTINAGTYNLNGKTQTIRSLAGAGAVALGAATGKLTVDGSDVSTFSGVVSGSGSWVKKGSGTLTLAGVNTYTGGTTIDGGRLIVAVPNGNYTDNAELEFAPTVDRTYSGVVSGSGALTKSGAGTLTLGALNNYGGSTTVNQGLLRNGVNGALPAATALIVDASGAYSLNGKTQTIASLSGGGAVGLGGGALTVDTAGGTTYSGALSGAGSFTKAGVGTLTLAGSLASEVDVQIAGGVLKGSADVFKGNVGSAGGTLQFDQAKAGTYAGTFSGAGALLKTGSRSLTLANAPTNTGGVRVAGGTLAIDAEGAFGGGLSVDAGATAMNTSGGILTVGGRTSVQGVLDTTEGSTTVFTGLVSGAGRFGDYGRVRFDGGYSPGNSPASVTFQGDLTLGGANELTMELGGTTLGTGYDHLNVLGTATLGGALNVAYLNGFSASSGQSFDLFDFKSSNGAFASISLPALGDGLRWNTSSLYLNGQVSVQAVPEPASLAALGLGGLALLRRRRKS